MQVSAVDDGELHSSSPWLYVNSRGPLKGQGMGAALVRNNEIRLPSLGRSLHLERRLGAGESIVQKAERK